MADKLLKAQAGSTLKLGDTEIIGTLSIDSSSINIVESAPLSNRNVIINGNFDIWQRGTSQTSSGYGSDDRWVNINNGSTKTHSQQAFALGQTEVPGNPKYFSRTVVSSVAGASSYAIKQQRIESVTTLAGQTATLSFWAKADAPKNMAVEFRQDFGTGGSPSAAVEGIGVTTIALTTSWKKYTVTVDIPSVAGKTLGTNGNDCLAPHFWFEGGSAYDNRTNSLGQQSGTFDIAQVQLEAGSKATAFERRPYGTELALCQRYCFNPIAGNSNSAIVVAPAIMTSTTAFNGFLSLKTSMRIPPSLTANSLGNFALGYFASGATITSLSINTGGTTKEYVLLNGNVATALTSGGLYHVYRVFTSGDLIFDAEL